MPQIYNKEAVPVLYYHSVGNHKVKRPWSFLSMPYEIFEKQMRWLKSNDYYTCDWRELDSHINGEKELPEKTVMLQFDDGFLDNWTVVFPLMKELNLKFSIVVSPDFVEESGEVRSFCDSPNEDNLEHWWGYLNSAEIRALEESGLCDIQCHGFSHTWYESSKKVIDIVDGGLRYPHLLWNSNSESKPRWLAESNCLPLTGYPVFEFTKSLELDRRFVPSPELIEALKKFYEQNSNEKKEILLRSYQDIVNKYDGLGKAGSWETNEEAQQRLLEELRDSKAYLSSLLKKDVSYIVFPGGGTSERILELCNELGYRLVSKGNRLNEFGSKIYQISRYSGYYQFPFLNGFLNLTYLKLQLRRSKKGSLVNKLFSVLKKYV